jgi:hypothetical protein
MHALARFFVQLALLRAAPQDLPASTALLALLAALGVLVGTVNGARIFGGAGAAFGANLLDLAMTLALLALLVGLRGFGGRWLQTATAFQGLGVLAGLAMLVTQAFADLLSAVDVAVLVDLVVAVWLHVALGHVLRHALEVPLMAGVLIVLAYTMTAFNIVARIFPVATSA